MTSTNNHNIATIINYCTNDYRFIHDCIKHVIPFSKIVFIPICDHFFDGTTENRHLLDKTYLENTFPAVRFIEYAYDPTKTDMGSNYWHNMSRYIGYKHLDTNIDYILCLDADEIVDTQLFQNWLNSDVYKQYDSLRPSNYWYFREPKYQAKTHESSALLIKKSKIKEASFFGSTERHSLHAAINGEKAENVLSLNQTPMIHHYSWVRTKEEMLKKVSTWGHNKDRDWIALVEKEFQTEFQGKDFVHGYEFETVTPFTDTKQTQDISPSVKMENLLFLRAQHMQQYHHFYVPKKRNSFLDFFKKK